MAGEPYAFEATPPPFSKKREGKGSKVACTNCRTSKLRCSGDPGCCRRCSNKKFDCEYPSPPRSNSQSNNQSPQLPTVSEPAVGDSPVQIESPFDLPYSGSLLDTIHDFGIPDLPTPGVTGSLLDDSANKRISPEIQPLWQKHQASTAGGNQPFGSGLSEIDDLVFETSDSLPPPKPSNTASQSVCSCLQQAMSTNEAIEVTMWGQKELLTDIYDVLQQQKAALARCEELLACQTCCIQPSYVMLLLSICRKFIETLQKTCQGPAENRTSGMTASSESGTETRKRKKSSYEDKSVDGRQRYGISIRERQLDDDDEYLVLQSLVAIRIKILNRILSRLDKVVSQYNWPVHKGVCRELRISLSAASSYKE